MERFVQKKIRTLYPVTSFSKLTHGHFSASITKFSEQLSLTTSYIVIMSKWERMLD